MIKLRKTSKVLTDTGIKSIGYINDNDLLYDGESFKRVGVNKTYSDNVCEIMTVRGYDVCGDFCLKKLTNHNTEISNVINFNTLDSVISHKSIIGHQINNSKILKDHGCEYNNRLKIPYKLPSVITEELAYFLGYSYGDGYINHEHYSLFL